jgi:hypothetical protein
VLHFVKAVPRSKEASQCLEALGLPTEAQRFAIVEAYVATDAQDACSSITLKDQWAAAVAAALVKARQFGTPKDFITLLKKCREQAMVLRVGKQSRVTLTRRSGASGTLYRLAIPVSGNFEHWYHRQNDKANWAVIPVVRIDRRRATVTLKKSMSRTMTAAMDAIRDTLMYFVHTHSLSNNKM